jgi:hypothetical protein
MPERNNQTKNGTRSFVTVGDGPSATNTPTSEKDVGAKAAGRDKISGDPFYAATEFPLFQMFLNDPVCEENK